MSLCAGATGLQLKNIIEKRTGVLYPDMSHRYPKLPLSLKKITESKRDENAQRQAQARQRQVDVNRDHMQDPAQPSNSHDVSDVGQDEGYDTLFQSQGNAPMNTDAVDAPQELGAARSMEGVTNPATPGGALYCMKSLGSPTFTFFKKSRFMHTWGFASNQFKLGPKNHEGNFLGYTTSLAYVPVDWIPFYLTHAEFQWLPVNSYIKEVSVQIIPKGVRCSFDTGSTLTGSANSMHVIFGKHCVGLNHQVDHVNVILKNNPNKPMEISNFEFIKATDFTQRFYGNPGSFHGNGDVVYPSSWGANRALPAYAMIVTSNADTNTNPQAIKTGWPQLDQIIERYNFNEHINSPCISYTYKPKNGILKHLYTPSVVPNKVKFFSGRQDIGTKHTQFLRDANFQNTHFSMSPSREKDGQKFAYENIVEKTCMIGYPNNSASNVSQPQVHIGIEPVQSNAPADTSPSWVNASAEYEIRASCVIGVRNDLMYADGPYGRKMDLQAAIKQNHHEYFISQNQVAGHYCYNWQGSYKTELS